MSIRIVLADDHAIVREGLKSLLEHDLHMEVIGEAQDGEESITLARTLDPDVVLMDVTMSQLNGIDATRRIVAENPSVKVIALSMHSDKQFISEMFSAGASAYLAKDCVLDELDRAIKAVLARRAYISPSVAGTVVRDYLDHLNASPPSILTTKERAVLQLIAEGKNTKEISLHHRISVKTVEGHRKRIMEKLDIHTVAELTKYAIRAGLTWLER